MIFLGTKDGTVYRGMNRTISVKEPINVTDNNITFLFQNYPNPFNPTTTIKYSIPKDEFVKLAVYDISGKIVKKLVNGHKSAGIHSVEFNANNYVSGTYYYRLEAGRYKDIKKMMLIK